MGELSKGLDGSGELCPKERDSSFIYLFIHSFVCSFQRTFYSSLSFCGGVTKTVMCILAPFERQKARKGREGEGEEKGERGGDDG